MENKLELIEFSEDHVDVLKELINIAIGAATANIADLLNTFGTMHVPSVHVATFEELKSYIESSIPLDERNYVTKQLFAGEFGGENMFIISEQSAINLGNHLYNTQDTSEDDMLDAVVELTNILSSTIIGRLTEELDTQVQFVVPSTELITGPDHIVDAEDIHNYQQVIIISTVMEFKDEHINGNIYIMTKNESIESLKKLIDKKLAELYS